MGEINLHDTLVCVLAMTVSTLCGWRFSKMRLSRFFSDEARTEHMPAINSVWYPLTGSKGFALGFGYAETGGETVPPVPEKISEGAATRRKKWC